MDKIINQKHLNDNELHKQFLDYNLKQEIKDIQWFEYYLILPFIYNFFNFFRDFIKSDLNPPIVFSHCDPSFENILKLSEDKIILIDYEDSCYNYRYFQNVSSLS